MKKANPQGPISTRGNELRLISPIATPPLSRKKLTNELVKHPLESSRKKTIGNIYPEFVIVSSRKNFQV